MKTLLALSVLFITGCTGAPEHHYLVQFQTKKALRNDYAFLKPEGYAISAADDSTAYKIALKAFFQQKYIEESRHEKRILEGFVVINTESWYELRYPDSAARKANDSIYRYTQIETIANR